MNYIRRTFLLPAAALFLAGTAFGQNNNPDYIINISDGGEVGGILCNEIALLTDSGGESGGYGENESHLITLCVDESAVESNAQFIISPQLYGHTWDVDDNSTLFIYDGPDTDGDLLGTFNTTSHPNGIILQSTGRCLTFEFVSGEGSSGAGFSGTFACPQPLQPFQVFLSTEPPLEAFAGLPIDSEGAIKICYTDSITITVGTNYPLSDAGGYEQSDETTLFRYDMGDGTIYQGFGMTQIGHVYDEPFGYEVSVQLTDVQGRIERTRMYVLTAPRPIFSNIPTLDTLCIGEVTTITGGITDTDTLGVEPNTSAILGGGNHGEQLFLPDGNNVNYETTITIEGFEPDQVINSVSDIVNMCVNMEHSYLGDLEMMLTCPNGTSVNIFNAYSGNGLFPGGFGGGGTYLGDANDDGSNDPGIGLTYCWTSDDPEFGTLGEEHAAGNTVPANTFQTGWAMTPGTYAPEESYEEFIGCPINGDWTLTIRDNLSIDNGWIFNWAIYFHPDINPATIYFSPQIDSVYWDENPDITSNFGTTIEVTPSVEGDNYFVFNAVDEFGCRHDTTINVYVRPYTTIEDNIACDLTHVLAPEHAPAGGVWTTISQPFEDANAVFEYLGEGVAEVVVDRYGIYEFEIVEENCQYTDTAAIDFRPDPDVTDLVNDTTLCIGASIVLNAGEQADNSHHFAVTWTRDGVPFNTEDLSVEINTTGQYIVSLIGACGSDADTVNIVAIEMDIAGLTEVCGLENPGLNVTLEPEGYGTWTSPSEHITFGDPNGLFTTVNSGAYGSYDVTFTDARCLEDGMTKTITFVEQPVVTISPDNPIFCFESDTLKLVASVKGSHDGMYMWNITGTDAPGLDSDQDDTQIFPPESFEPLEIYNVSVTVLDGMSPHVCETASTSVIFEGQACVYHIPNIISPNGDGKNDKFHIEYIESFPSTRLRVFNRWGNLVFEQDDYDRYQRDTGGWSPDDIEPGVYFYELAIPYIDRLETGNITILEAAK